MCDACIKVASSELNSSNDASPITRRVREVQDRLQPLYWHLLQTSCSEEAQWINNFCNAQKPSTTKTFLIQER